MSDYGFATYDERNDKKRLGSVNSKWPIFGPKYADISRGFKTIHITETYEPDYKTADLPEPVIPSGSYYAYNDYRWHEKQLIYQYEHGYKFRPMGYAVFSGDLTINVLCTITQTETITGNTSSYGGNFTISGRAVQDIPILPNVKSQMVASYVSTSYNPVELSIGNYFFGIGSVDGTGSNVRRDITIPNECVSAIKRDYTVASSYVGDADRPYIVEIDEKYVKIYRNTYWLDYRGKWYSSYTPQSYPELNYTHNIDARVKGATSYAGSSLDCTIYLAPYRLEDFV